MVTAHLIAKEEVPSLRFSATEVLAEEAKRILRSSKLRKALALGNLFKNKVRMIFVTEDGDEKQVETTIWAVTENYVSLKGGAIIPTQAIKDVEF